ncbi:MAG: hypothetical protein AAGD32_18235 [Planctomycetota bacterium]
MLALGSWLSQIADQWLSNEGPSSLNVIGTGYGANAIEMWLDHRIDAGGHVIYVARADLIEGTLDRPMTAPYPGFAWGGPEVQLGQRVPLFPMPGMFHGKRVHLDSFDRVREFNVSTIAVPHWLIVGGLAVMTVFIAAPWR